MLALEVILDSLKALDNDGVLNDEEGSSAIIDISKLESDIRCSETLASELLRTDVAKELKVEAHMAELISMGAQVVGARLSAVMFSAVWVCRRS